MYLTAVFDGYSRYAVSWRLSNTMRAHEVVACARDAFASHGTPYVMDSDQRSAFGSEEYVSLLISELITQSMDGRARRADNVLMKRWFRTFKSDLLKQQEYEIASGMLV